MLTHSPPVRLPGAFRDQVYAIVGAIPPGRLMTYGGIAALIPPPKGVDVAGYERVRARWAGYALAACPDEIPWHRVVNAQGRISPRPGPGPHDQRALLEAEGVKFTDRGVIDLAAYVWEPQDGWLKRRRLMVSARSRVPAKTRPRRSRQPRTPA